MAALTRSGARKASEIVMLILRTLQRSRAAITSISGAPASSNSLCHFLPRAIAATSLIRASDRIALLSADPMDDGRMISRLIFDGGFRQGIRSTLRSNASLLDFDFLGTFIATIS